MLSVVNGFEISAEVPVLADSVLKDSVVADDESVCGLDTLETFTVVDPAFVVDVAAKLLCSIVVEGSVVSASCLVEPEVTTLVNASVDVPSALIVERRDGSCVVL